MSLPQTYSRRKRQREREQSGAPDVYRTDLFGPKLLVQLLQIMKEMDSLLGYDAAISPKLVDYVSKELGVLGLSRDTDAYAQLFSWFSGEVYNDNVGHDLRLDVVELACNLVLEASKKFDQRNHRHFDSRKAPIAWHLVQTLNARMLEDGFGYQVEGGQIIELTSRFEHEEVVRPALAILSQAAYAAANTEFRDAFEEFKQGNYDDCVADCGNAFESVIKVIGSKRGWTNLQPNDSAAKLIDHAKNNGLFPSYMGEQFKGLTAMLQGGPSVRNKEGGHGAGEQPRITSKHLAAYQLHQTAAAIIFLAECDRQS